MRHAKRSLNAPYKVSTSFCWSPSPFNSRCLYAFTIFPEFSRFVKVDKSTGIKLARIRPLFPTFLLFVLLLVVIWSYPEQGYNLTTRHFVWLVRSPGTVPLDIRSAPALSTFKTCSKHICFLMFTSLTDCFQSMSIEQCTGSLVVTLAMLPKRTV